MNKVKASTAVLLTIVLAIAVIMVVYAVRALTRSKADEEEAESRDDEEAFRILDLLCRYEGDAPPVIDAARPYVLAG